MVVQELIAKLGFDVDQGGLNSVDNALGNFAKKLTLAAAGIYAVKKAVEATVWAISGSIEAAAQKEDVTTQFKVMLGDLEAAKYLYQEINQYAAVSPFETAGLAEGVKGLMSAGMSAKAAFTDIKMMGDIALGNQEKLNRLSYVYGQTQSAHKLKGDDLRQYTEQGFSPLEVMARKTGKSIEYYRKEMEQGRFTADMVRESLVIATSEGGRFYKGAEEGSKTWNGMLSTLKDNVRMLGAELGEKVLPFLKDVLQALFGMWESIAGAYRQLAEFMGVFLKDGPEATTIAATIATSFGVIADAIMVVLTLWQSFMVLMRVGQVTNALFIGLLADGVDLLTTKMFGLQIVFAKIAKGFNFMMMGIGKITGNKEMEASARASMLSADAQSGNYDLLGSTKQALGYAGGELSGSWDKMTKMYGMIGGEKAGSGPLKETDRIRDLLAGKAGKQPVTINNQTNNLTINADDPIKSLGDAAASKFFQSAFIELRHATV